MYQYREHFQHYRPWTEESFITEGKRQHTKLKRMLLEVDREATKTLHKTRVHQSRRFSRCMLILADMHRMILDLHLCSASSVSVISAIPSWSDRSSPGLVHLPPPPRTRSSNSLSLKRARSKFRYGMVLSNVFQHFAPGDDG